jgi:hypothetical protein
LKKYLSHKNEFTLLHHAVWTGNKELCLFLCQNNFKIDHDRLGIQPYVYSLRIGNKEIINILKPSHIEKFNENEKLIIKNDIESNIGKDFEEMDIIEDESFFENYHQPQTKYFTNLKENIVFSQNFNMKKNMFGFWHPEDEEEEEGDDSEPDLEEETIQIQNILNSPINEISKEVDQFEKVILFENPKTYLLKRVIVEISRKPSKKRELNYEVNSSKKRKLENPATRSSEVILSKYSFNPVIKEIGLNMMNNINFTPLAYLILQQISENLLGSFFQEIEILQNLGFPHEKAFHLLYSFSYVDHIRKKDLGLDHEFQGPIQKPDESEDSENSECEYQEYFFESDGEFEPEYDCSSSEEERDYLIEDYSEEDDEPLLGVSSTHISDEMFHKMKEQKNPTFPNKYYVEEEEEEEEYSTNFTEEY